jgi:hypothetical protein
LIKIKNILLFIDVTNKIIKKSTHMDKVTAVVVVNILRTELKQCVFATHDVFEKSYDEQLLKSMSSQNPFSQSSNL